MSYKNLAKNLDILQITQNATKFSVKNLQNENVVEILLKSAEICLKNDEKEQISKIFTKLNEAKSSIELSKN